MRIMKKLKSYFNQDYMKLERNKFKKDLKEIRDVQRMRDNNIMLSQRL